MIFKHQGMKKFALDSWYRSFSKDFTVNVYFYIDYFFFFRLKLKHNAQIQSPSVLHPGLLTEVSQCLTLTITLLSNGNASLCPFCYKEVGKHFNVTVSVVNVTSLWNMKQAVKICSLFIELLTMCSALNRILSQAFPKLLVTEIANVCL